MLARDLLPGVENARVLALADLRLQLDLEQVCEDRGVSAARPAGADPRADAPTGASMKVMGTAAMAPASHTEESGEPRASAPVSFFDCPYVKNTPALCTAAPTSGLAAPL